MTTPAGLVGAVQRFGLFSAASVVARYTEMVDGAIAGEAFAPVDAGKAARSVLGLLDAAAGLLRTDAHSSGAVVLPSVAAGCTTAVSFWMHNGTASPVPMPELHVGPLMSAGGACVPAGLVPPGVDALPAAGAVEVRLRVDVPAGQPAGIYHGLVLTSAAPDEPLPVRLEVR